jgi:hypothetical protein
MKKIIFISVFCFVFGAVFSAENDTVSIRPDVPEGGKLLYTQVIDGDTIFYATLRDIWVFPKSSLYKNKKEEQFFWRTVRDVKRTLPYARLVSTELIMVNQKLAELPNDKERKKFINKYEKEVFAKYEKDLRKMTVSQGKMLIKLVDRECDKTSYELVKFYKGGFVAFFWQGIAKLFGSNLKDGYDAKDKDKVVERIILLVESGQL